MQDIHKTLTTERQNPKSMRIDQLSTLEMMQLINGQDKRVALAVKKELPAIACAVDAIAEKMQAGGRLIYCGAGTSGRLGVLDAAECPPTFGVSPEQVVGVIAGGNSALTRSQEGAEDDEAGGRADLLALNPQAADVAVGLSASGQAPYVLGFLAEAKNHGMATIGISCNADSCLAKQCDIAISPVVGPEVITGSTRMKAGTAQKMVLNMLSTGAMIRLGKVYGNLMVDMQATNRKLRDRAIHIVMQAAGVSKERAKALINAANGKARLAIDLAVSQCDGQQNGNQ